MKTWSEFYPDLLSELPGAPLPVVDLWLRNVAAEFCERSKAYIVDLDPQSSAANRMDYAIDMPTETELVEVRSVLYSGQKLTPKSPTYLEQKYGDWSAERGTPEFYTQQDSANVLLVPVPSVRETNAVKIKAAAKPSVAATGIDDQFYSRYRQAIVAGVKGKMMAMAGGVDWQNPVLASVNLGMYEGAIATATGQANDGFVRSIPRFSGGFC